MAEELKPCYNCGSNDLLHIKNFNDYHMVKCEHCIIQDDGVWVCPLEGGDTWENAKKAWNKRYDK